MRELIVTEFITADGVIDSPGGGAHPHGGWTFTDVAFDEAAYEIKGREQEEAGAMLLGRVSYEEFAPVWPSMTEDFAGYNAMPKYVVSTTLEQAPWGDQEVTILRSLEEVARLKEQDGGPIIVHGSATLAQGLARAGLVDRYHLLVFPVVIGSGKRLFDPDADKRTFTVTESQAYPNGVVKLVYAVGAPEAGAPAAEPAPAAQADPEDAGDGGDRGEQSCTGTFEIAVNPGDGLLPGTGRMDFTKTWSGEIGGVGQGVMLSGGDPTQGTAGYVALETFTGTLAGNTGSFALQQNGSMQQGEVRLDYAIVPGSGTQDLTGLTGSVDLTVVDGIHHVVVRYRLP